MTRIFTLAAVAAVAISAHAAAANGDPDQPRMTVKYADLNLASPAGVANLYSRIQNAAANACASVGDDRSLGGLNANKACREEMVIEGVRGMQLQALTELAAGGSIPTRVASH